MTSPCPGQSSSSTYTTNEVDGCTILFASITSITVLTIANTNELATSTFTPVFKILFTCNDIPGTCSLDMSVLAPDGVTSINSNSLGSSVLTRVINPLDPTTCNYLTFIDGVTLGTMPSTLYDQNNGSYAIYLPALAGSELIPGDVTLSVTN